MVSDRLFDRACNDLQAQTKKVFELEQMNSALRSRVARLEEALKENINTVLDRCTSSGRNAQNCPSCAGGEMSEQKLRLTMKPCGDCWLHIDAPSGKKASINLGQRGGWNDQTLVGQVIREAAEALEEK